MLIAVTRPVSASFDRCQLTHLAREPIDGARATAQHSAYENLLRSLGATLVQVPAAPEMPDAVFVEDTAVVLEEIAVLTRPGAPSRQAEPPAVGEALAAFRPLSWMTAPATLDGGDVLRLGKALYIGRSSRTNAEGLEQLADFVAPFGYRVVPVDFTGCLHLKSAVTALAEDLLLVNPAWVSTTALPRCEVVFVDPLEPSSANALAVAGSIVYPAQFPRTCERLVKRGLRVATIDCGEITKAEGAVTCCSILLKSP